MSETLPLDADTRAKLDRLSFDVATFEKLRRRLLSGEAGDAHNRIHGRVEVPAAGDVTTLPREGSEERRALEARGLDAVRRGKVGAVVLAGGMATRFGGVVKAAVPAVDAHTFLDLKLRDVAALAKKAGGTIPVYLMASFATEKDVTELGERASTERVPVETFTQCVSIRLTPEGELFHEDGAPSLYAPGHGDLTFSLRSSGVLSRFLAQGGETLFMSNVDNVAATLDPVVIGAHLASNAAVTAEVTAKEKGDKGGAPARVDGRVQIVEAFRFPEGFDQDAIPVFNTNTFVLDAKAIDRDFPLTWFAVRKTVDDRPAIQFERLVGELTAFLPSHFVEVPRTGAGSRFLPVKDPPELDRRREEMRLVLGSRGAL